MALRIGELTQVCHNHAIESSIDAVKKLTQWTLARKLREAHAENCDLFSAVVGEVAARAAQIAEAKFVDHHDPEQPVGVFAIARSTPDQANAEVIGSPELAEFAQLATALGITPPSTGPLSGVIVSLIMRELMRLLDDWLTS